MDDRGEEMVRLRRAVGSLGVEAFAPLEDSDLFKQVKVDPEIGTLVWPNEVDFCPDALYSEATGKLLLEAARLYDQ